MANIKIRIRRGGRKGVWARIKKKKKGINIKDILKINMVNLNKRAVNYDKHT